MIVYVAHRSAYAYASPARGAIQLLRLTPRDYESQHVRSWRVEVDPPARLRESEDFLGNRCHMFDLEGPFQSLIVNVEGEVDVMDAAGVVRGAHETFPPDLFLRDTALTVASDELKIFAANAVRDAGHSRLARLHALMRDLRGLVRFDRQGTDSATTAASAFALGCGVCQDFAHMFIACARSQAIPARYVSGYMALSDGVTTQDASHAWAEAFVDDLGWVGFDPANGVSPTEVYVRVAIGLDYLGAAPILGARHGGGVETLDVRLSVGPTPSQIQS